MSWVRFLMDFVMRGAAPHADCWSIFFFVHHIFEKNFLLILKKNVLFFCVKMCRKIFSKIDNFTCSNVHNFVIRIDFSELTFSYSVSAPRPVVFKANGYCITVCKFVSYVLLLLPTN